MSRSPLIVTLFGLLLPSTHAVAEDWYRFRGPRLDGISRESPWDESSFQAEWPVAWTASVGTGFSSVVVSEGRLYTMGNSDNVETVFCLDCKTGEEIWSQSYPAPIDPNEFEGGPTATPTVDGGLLYTLGRRGDLHCFDKTDGEIRWRSNLADQADVRIPAWGFAGSPLVCDELLILNVGDAGTAVNKLDGELAWNSADKDAGYSTPVPVPQSNPKQVILGSARSYVCVEAPSGKEIWRQRWLTTFGCNAADPILDGDHLFLSSGYNRGSALLEIVDDTSTEVVWKNKEMQNQISTSVLIDGFVYGIHGDVDEGPVLRCLDWATGEVQWSDATVRPGGLSAAGDRLILISDSGELILGLASPRGFQTVFRQRVLNEKCWTAPVLSNGRVYCRGAAGTLVCLQAK